MLDFGVAKAPDPINFSLTQTSNIIGSPGYMSPEQLKSSKSVDVRSDIWSLGVVLYELVSGHPPFNGESITELALRVAMDPMPPLVGMGPFEAVIEKCLAKDPAQRFQNVAELAIALATYAGPRGTDLANAVVNVLRGSNPSVVQTTMPVASVPTTLRGASGVVTGATRSSGGWKLPAAIGMIAGLAIIVVIMLMTRSGDDRSSTPAAASTPTEPAKSDPATTTEPAKPDPIKTEPAKPDPKAESARSEPAKPDPVKTEPVVEATKPAVEATKADPSPTKSTVAKTSVRTTAKKTEPHPVKIKTKTKKDSVEAVGESRK